MEDYIDNINSKLYTMGCSNKVKKTPHTGLTHISNVSVSNQTTRPSPINDQLVSVTAENKIMKETILDLQAHSLRDNLIFSGIPEPPAHDLEKTIKF